MIQHPTSHIVGNHYQARADYGDVAELAQQITAAAAAFPTTLGLMQPPHARPISSTDGDPDTGYPVPVPLDQWDGVLIQLLYGHRRLKAFQYLAANGRPEYSVMPVTLIYATDHQMLDAVWSENRARRDLTAIEEARLMRAAIDGLRLNQASLANRWGLARSTVANRVALLDMPAAVQDAIQQRQMSERVAMSLAPIFRLWDSVLENWTESPHNSEPAAWLKQPAQQYLPHPDAMIAHLVAGGEATSDQVRDYVNRALAGSSTFLDPAIAAADYTGVEGIRQATCRGCPARWQNRCFDRACLTQKLAEFGRPITQQAAEKYGLPISADPAHFLPWEGLHQVDELRTLWRAGTCPHLVVGWFPEQILLRPELGAGNQARLETIVEQPGIGVALGCTHGRRHDCRPTRDQIAAAAVQTRRQTSDDPLEIMAPQWETEHSAAMRRLEKIAHALVWAWLNDHPAGPEWALLCQLRLADNDRRYTPEPGQARRTLFQDAWQKSTYHPSRHSHLPDVRARYETLLRTLGIDPTHLDAGRSPDDLTYEACVAVCRQWHNTRSYHWAVRDKCAEIRYQLDSLLPQLTPRAGSGVKWIDDMIGYLSRVSAELDAAAAAK